jgi:hypothetical protein
METHLKINKRFMYRLEREETNAEEKPEDSDVAGLGCGSGEEGV